MSSRYIVQLGAFFNNIGCLIENIHFYSKNNQNYLKIISNQITQQQLL